MALLGGFGYFVLDDGRLSGVVLEEMLKGSLFSEKRRERCTYDLVKIFPGLSLTIIVKNICYRKVLDAHDVSLILKITALTKDYHETEKCRCHVSSEY